MNISLPLVSIIIPIYNTEHYLVECIESVLKQTYENWELILINDGSTDNSAKIIDFFREKDVRIRGFHKKNAGVSSARNVGILMSKGDYICFSDADDKLMPDYIEYLLKLVLKYDADISYTVDMFTSFHKKQIKTDKIRVFTPEEATVALLSYHVPIGVYSKMFKRDFLLKNKLQFIPEIFIGEGFNFNIACFQLANKIIVGKRKIYFYRRDNEESAMTKFNIKKCEMALYAIDNIKKNLLIKTNKVLTAWEFANWHTNCDMYYWMVNSNAKKECKLLYNQCRWIAWSKAYYALYVPTKLMERIRAFIMFLSPYLVAKLVFYRNTHQL